MLLPPQLMIFYVYGLKHNLLSIINYVKKWNIVIFDSNGYIIEGLDEKQVRFVGHIVNNMYMIG